MKTKLTIFMILMFTVSISVHLVDTRENQVSNQYSPDYKTSSDTSSVQHGIALQSVQTTAYHTSSFTIPYGYTGGDMSYYNGNYYMAVPGIANLPYFNLDTQSYVGSGTRPGGTLNSLASQGNGNFWSGNGGSNLVRFNPASPGSTSNSMVFDAYALAYDSTTSHLIASDGSGGFYHLNTNWGVISAGTTVSGLVDLSIISNRLFGITAYTVYELDINTGSVITSWDTDIAPMEGFEMVSTNDFWMASGFLFYHMSFNILPIGNPDSYKINEDQISIFNVTDNDVDPDSNGIYADITDSPSHGTIQRGYDGDFKYTPDANYFGRDSFTYHLHDIYDTDNTTIPVSITINSVDDDPVAVPDSYSTNESTTLTVNSTNSVLNNDYDVDYPDGSSLSAQLVSGPAGFYLNTDGTFTYTPDPNYYGIVTFMYKVLSQGVYSNTVTVTINVSSTNHAPTANDDIYTCSEYQGGVGSPCTGNVLGNDYDADGDTLNATLYGAPSHQGTFTFNSDGTFSYLPELYYTTTVVFTYLASDGEANALGYVTLEITNVPNYVPVANPDRYVMDQGSVLRPSTSLLDNDVYDPDFAYSIGISIDNPSHGTITYDQQGYFTYTPFTYYSGTDTFNYTLVDINQVITTATITITINSINNAHPVTSDDTYQTDEDTNLGVGIANGVLSNDYDAENDPLTAILITSTSHGELAFLPSGTFGYYPDANFNGIDTFTYVASDGYGNSSVATVQITVLPVNDAPIGVDDAYTTTQGAIFMVDSMNGALANDYDPDGDSFTAGLVSGPSSGTLTLNANGSFTYIPNTGFVGTDSFQYYPWNGLDGNYVTVSIVVTANAAPVANNDSYQMTQDTSLEGNVLDNDYDSNGDTLTVVVVSYPTHGSLNMDSGYFIYTPDKLFYGNDNFTYYLSDGIDSSNTVTVSIQILFFDYVPISYSDTYVMDEDTILVVDSLHGVLANDTELNGQGMDAYIDTMPSHGTLVLNLNGSFTYTPDPNFSGIDSFVYVASDPFANYGHLTLVTIIVNNINDKPAATPDT